MARVLSISSQTVFGPVGNSATVPALQAEGHEVLQVPTVLLSNHPGHGKPSGSATEPALLQDILTALARLDALTTCAAVLTGYFASATQVEVAAHAINTMKAANPGLMVLVDPVMGDGGRLYVPEAVAVAIKTLLVPLATTITPNLFELGWISSAVIEDRASAIAAARALGIAEVIITSVPGADGTLETILVAADAERHHITERLTQVPHGTGDFLAGCYLAKRLQQPARPAFDSVMERLGQVIRASAGSAVLNPIA